MRHIPNILSAFRLVLVGVFVWLFRAGKYLPALCVFALAFFTDILDGYLARKNGWVSNLGKLLDPLADKLMTVAALSCIYFAKRHAVYLVLFLLMAVKELLMLAGGLFMVRRKVTAYAGWPGKLATGLFAVGIALALLSLLPLDVGNADMAVLTAAACCSLYALFYYATHQLREALGRPRDPSRRQEPG